MAVEGLDIGWLGHFDLTNSMGIPGQFDHPDFLAAVDRLIAACRVASGSRVERRYLAQLGAPMRRRGERRR